MIRLAYPWLLPWAALAVLLAMGAGAFWRRRRRRAAEALADAGLLRRVAPGLDRSRVRPALWTAAAVLLGLASTGPLVGTERGTQGSTLPDVVLVLDASNSMRVEDLRPNRLEVQRGLARELVRRLAGTRVGLVVFAGQGYVVSPLTRDGSALDAYLEALTPEMVPQGGSSLSHALRQGGGLVGAAAGGAPGALLLMTDGDGLEDPAEVDQVASLLERAAIPVHTVGVATRGGGLVPDVDSESGERLGYKKEPDGSPARSALGESLLRSISQKTGGSYSAAGPETVEALVSALYVSGTTRPAWNDARPGNRYAWLVAGALLLLLLDSILASRTAGRRPE